jgi:NAD(P)-dependent dehydrogenase (short-subunit alcohol dehydrogenase family)
MSYTRYASLQGRVVFVSGGSSGIGAELVRAFAQQGARVAFCGTRPDGGRPLADELAAAGLPAPWYAACDVRDVAAYQAVLARAAADLGPVRVLVNNAGRDDRHRMEDVTPEFWDDRLALNLKHYFFAIQAVAPGMEKAGGGSVVNMGSVSWMRGRPNLAGYTTAKAGILGLTRTLARELGGRGIRVNALVPGAIVDLAIIGGGATGLGVALDAAARGFSVVLVESTTSPRAPRRAPPSWHGGVRYLAQGDVSLVHEALARAGKPAGQCAARGAAAAFVMPGYRWWEPAFYGVGPEGLRRARGLAAWAPPSCCPRAHAELLPGVKPRGLCGGVKYWDGQFDDARLAVLLARTAAARGALVLNHCAAPAAAREAGKVRGAGGARRETGRARSTCAHAAWSTPPVCGSMRCATWTATKAAPQRPPWWRPARVCT